MTQYLEKYSSNLVPLSSKKAVYYIENDPWKIVKIYAANELNKMEKEFRLHEKAMAIVRCPTIVECFIEDNVGYFIMNRIVGKTLYELYGDDTVAIPKELWKKVRLIIYELFCADVHYVDITPYNFMIEAATGELHILDFGDAYECKVNWFLKEFIDGSNSWNPDFE